jgi:hypothetical protein
MWAKGGVQPFMTGSKATVLRDVKFGGVFALLRYYGNRRHFTKDNSHPKVSLATETLTNIGAGCVATMVSSPMNYVRNVHYSTPPGTPPADIATIMRNLSKETKKHHRVLHRMQHVQSRLRIGWGTARVGCGMAFASKMYSVCSENREVVDGTIDDLLLK